MDDIVEFIRERSLSDLLDDKIENEYHNAILSILLTHKEWPVLIHRKPEPMQIETIKDFNSVRYSLIENIEWGTRQSYVERFGEQAPTTPILKALAKIWDWHPDYNVAWA